MFTYIYSTLFWLRKHLGSSKYFNEASVCFSSDLFIFFGKSFLFLFLCLCCPDLGTFPFYGIFNAMFLLKGAYFYHKIVLQVQWEKNVERGMLVLMQFSLSLIKNLFKSNWPIVCALKNYNLNSREKFKPGPGFEPRTSSSLAWRSR